MRVGGVDVAAVRVGATPAAAVYVGAVKAWPADTGPAVPTLYTWYGKSSTADVGPGQLQRYGTGSAVFHRSGPASGPPLDFATAVGRTLELVGQTSGGRHVATVTVSNLVGGHHRLVLDVGIPFDATFTVGEPVAVTLT